MTPYSNRTPRSRGPVGRQPGRGLPGACRDAPRPRTGPCVARLALAVSSVLPSVRSGDPRHPAGAALASGRCNARARRAAARENSRLGPVTPAGRGAVVNAPTGVAGSRAAVHRPAQRRSVTDLTTRIASRRTGHRTETTGQVLEVRRGCKANRQARAPRPLRPLHATLPRGKHRRQDPQPRPEGR